MFEELGLAPAEFSADLPDAYGRMQPAFALPKRECSILVSGYSLTLRARIVDRWQELEAQVAQPATPPAMPASVEAVMFAEAVNRALRLEGSAALGMIRKATELTAPHLLPMLPAYAIDAPPSELATRGSSRPTASMLTILRSEFADRPQAIVSDEEWAKLVAGIKPVNLDADRSNELVGDDCASGVCPVR